VAFDGIAIGLAGLLVLELHFATRPLDVQTLRSAVIAPQTPNLDDTSVAAPPTVFAWRDVMLSRPLFDPTRRPSAPTVDPTAPVEIPRLSGIMITPAEKIAVFSPAVGPPIIASQNSRFGSFTVLAIADDSVTLKTPGGVIVLRSDFSAPGASGSATSKSTLVADGMTLSLIRIALPKAVSWPALPPAH